MSLMATRFTIKKPSPIHKVSTSISIKKRAKPEKKELVRGKFFFRYCANSTFVIDIIISLNYIYVY